MGYLIALPKDEILRRIVQGESEHKICTDLDIPMTLLVDELVANQEFADALTKARSIRSEKWVGNIVNLVQSETGAPIIHDKDDVPGVKLAIDTFKWLAKVDNPQRYGEKVDIDVKTTNIYELKGLSVSEALSIIKNDPFAPKDIDAEYVVQQRETTEENDEDML